MKLINYESNISQLPIVAFDFETTGLYPDKDRIIEIGGIKFQNRVTFSTFQTLTNPGMPIPAEASRINGITDEMVQYQPPLRITISNFLDFIRGSVLLAHNAGFDLGFLQAAVKALDLPPVTNPVLDSLELARYSVPDLMNHKLQTLAKFFRIDPGNAHRAQDDAVVCRDVFYACLAKIPGGDELSLTRLLEIACIKERRR